MSDKNGRRATAIKTAIFISVSAVISDNRIKGMDDLTENAEFRV